MRTLPDRPEVTDAPSPDADALIEEARQRQRRRRRIAAFAASMLVLAGVLTAVTVGGNGGRNASGGFSSHSESAGGAASRSNQAGAGVLTAAPPVVQSGLLNSTAGWAANGLGLYITTDAGRTWRTIAPKNLSGDDPVARMDELVATNPSHLWLPVGGVGLPGGRCIDGSCRGSAIDSSTDGGRTWRVTYLPGCLACDTAVSFLNDRDGFAVGQASTNDIRSSVRTYATTNGGRTWMLTATFAALIGGGANKLTFTTPNDGWFVASDLTRALLFRTTDGGSSWTTVALPALPADDTVLQISGPTFFGTSDGVLAAAVEDKATRQDRDLIYETSDAGKSWSTRSIAPAVIPNSDFNSDGNLSFSAASTTTWYLLAGDRSYVTRNAGRSWASRIPSAPWSHGAFQLNAIDFLTPTTGWVDLVYNSCGGLPRNSPSTRCSNEIGLASTQSSGRTWTLISAASGD